MKQVFSYLLGIVILASCGQSSSNNGTDTDSSANATTNDESGVQQSTSGDWSGTYEGTTPCADCPGIKTTVVLNNNDTFRITQEYQDRNTKTDDNGRIMWHGDDVAHLKGTNVDIKFKLGKGELKQLDQDGKEIEGDLAQNYVLKKIKEAELPKE